MTDTQVTSSRNDQVDAQYLFKPESLTKLLTWKEIDAGLNDKNLAARPLKLSDYNNGYLMLLSQLTKVGDINQDDFEKRFNLMRALNEINEHYAIVVIEDRTSLEVVGAASLVLELKFIHHCAMRGRIEEVVVLDSYRGKKIGETVVKILVDLAKEVYGCYKISLDCSDHLVNFYGKNGLHPDKQMLTRYFDE